MTDRKIIENELRNLCVMMIKQFDKLKERGLISPEEYENHTKQKKQFLENINK